MCHQQLTIGHIQPWLNQGHLRHLTLGDEAPCASTTIQARSHSSPLASKRACCTAIPAQDLIGNTHSAPMVPVTSKSVCNSVISPLCGPDSRLPTSAPFLFAEVSPQTGCPAYNVQPMAQTFDVCIRGAGIVGRTLALLLARERLRVALVAAPRAASAQADVRAYALNANSRQMLESLRAWPDASYATAVRHMEVHGDQDGSVHFDAQVQDVDALAWIVDVPALEQRLAEAVRYQPQVEVVDAPVDAPLTAICEGRASATRAEFGVDFDVTPTTSMRLPHACSASCPTAR